MEVTMNKQTAVSQIFAQMKAGRKDTKFWNDTMVIDWLFEAEEWLKQMEKEQINDAIKTEIKLIGNYFDVDKLEQREQGHHIRFTSILKDRFDHYNKK
jgi:7,8-dihydro-6-hydroxymethylpterin-pyrophosphokinase